MRKLIILSLAGLIVGIWTGLLIADNILYHKPGMNFVFNPLAPTTHKVIGFLPYWLISKADKNYDQYINTLTYFGLTLSSDGTIMKYTDPGESEPGWLALQQGKFTPFLNKAKKDNVDLSLLVFSGNENNIYGLLSDPVHNARTMVNEVEPVMRQNGFTDLNLDIESVIPASDEARRNFTSFVTAVRHNMDEKNLGTLTIDMSPINLVKKYLIDLNSIKSAVDYVVLMTYDYHYPGSYVTGAVGPVGGAGDEAEFDSNVAVQEAVKIVSPDKILLGIPLYGYEWETVDNTPHSAVIPGSGLTASNRRVEELLNACTDCTVSLDKSAEESYLIYQDKETGSFHQIYFPDEKATEQKLILANNYALGGVALWALGYEGSTILNPLKTYR